MKKLLIILSSVLMFTGCASNCKEACILGFGPGSDAFEVVAKHYDERDACQFKGKPAGYELPRFCGASKGKNVRVVKTSPNTYTVNQY
jgi:hypothetical protein